MRIIALVGTEVGSIQHICERAASVSQGQGRVPERQRTAGRKRSGAEGGPAWRAEDAAMLPANPGMDASNTSAGPPTYRASPLPLGDRCLRVNSAIDSQIVLDEPGGESLLGRGDLLCNRGRGLERAQSPYINQEELLRLANSARSSE